MTVLDIFALLVLALLAGTVSYVLYFLRARENNLTTKQALSVIRESRLRRAVVSRNLQPVVDVTGSYTRAKSSSQDPLFSQLPGVSATPFNLFSAGFDVTWEADVFGGIRRSVEAAAAGVGASIETYRDVLVTLFAEVARNYVDLRTFQQRAAYAEANIGLQSESLKLAKMRFESGRIRDAIQAQGEVTRQAVFGYENTVLFALAETESAIVAFREEERRLEALREAVAATKRAVGLVRTLYDTGLTGFQNVLDTERTLFLQQDGLAVSEGQVTKNLISLYKALGGGWSAATGPPEAQPMRPGEKSGADP